MYGGSAPGRPEAAERPRGPPFLGILQHRLQPSQDPLPGDSRKAFALAPGQRADWHSTVSESLHSQRGPAVGQPGHQACHPAGHVPACWGLTKQFTGEGNRKSLQYSCLENPINSMKRQKDAHWKIPRSVGVQFATGEEQRNSSRKNEEAEPKRKRCPVVDVSGNGSKVQCCKEQHCIGTWNVRSTNQDKLEVVKQEMAKVNIDILGISELTWTGMGEFNSDNHYIYYCGQESLRRNGIDLIVNSRVQNAVLGCNLKNDRMILVHFQGKSFSHHSNPNLCPNH